MALIAASSLGNPETPTSVISVVDPVPEVAEREGFEPSVGFPLRTLSKGVLSTTQPSFLKAGRRV